jgi:hypothetical protein
MLSVRNSHLAYNLTCLGMEKNVHVTYMLEVSKQVRSFVEALALRCRDKGKPAARRWRKAYGPLSKREVAWLPKGVSTCDRRHPPRTQVSFGKGLVPVL